MFSADFGLIRAETVQHHDWMFDLQASSTTLYIEARPFHFDTVSFPQPYPIFLCITGI